MGPLGLSYLLPSSRSQTFRSRNKLHTYTLRAVVCGCGVTMTAGHFNDPEYWRQKANEARAIARQLLNPTPKK